MRKVYIMEKEIRRVIGLLIGLILCIIWLTAHYTGIYYKEKYKTDRNDIEIAYQRVIAERDTYARMYYKSIGNEEMAKLYESEKKDKWFTLGGHHEADSYNYMFDIRNDFFWCCLYYDYACD